MKNPPPTRGFISCPNNFFVLVFSLSLSLSLFSLFSLFLSLSCFSLDLFCNSLTCTVVENAAIVPKNLCHQIWRSYGRPSRKVSGLLRVAVTNTSRSKIPARFPVSFTRPSACATVRKRVWLQHGGISSDTPQAPHFFFVEARGRPLETRKRLDRIPAVVAKIGEEKRQRR